jgi:uncharacterized protein YaaQ
MYDPNESLDFEDDSVETVIFGGDNNDVDVVFHDIEDAAAGRIQDAYARQGFGDRTDEYLAMPVLNSLGIDHIGGAA